jgi:tetratricopeptide (TPR) repeat protein
MAEKKVLTPEEELDDLNIPAIFLRDADDDVLDEHSEVAALRMLMEDEKPEDTAQNYRDSGNLEFKRKNYTKAVEHYTQSLQVGLSDNKFNSIVLSNRALVNLSLENYGRALSDSEQALKLDSSNGKAAFRAAKAAMQLSKHELALKHVKAGIVLEPHNSELRKLKQEIEKRQSIANAKSRETVSAQRGITALQSNEIAQLYSKQFTIGKPIFSMRAYTESGHRIYTDDDGSVHFPVVILYPEHDQSDFIQDLREDVVLFDQLSLIFDRIADWDVAQAYRPDSIQLYYETNQSKPLIAQRWFNKFNTKFQPIPSKFTIAQALRMPEHVIPQYPLLYAFVKDSDYLKRFLAEH